eukprot:g3144.t1
MAANAVAASPLFELKYYVRTFEAFANREDLEQALALWLMEDATATFLRTRPAEAAPLDGAVAAKFQAIQREKRDIEDRYGLVRIWDLSLLSDLSYLLPRCREIAEISTERYRELWAHMAQELGAEEHFGFLTIDINIGAGWDISGWDVSGATSMRGMFQRCETFNSDISAWNVRKVEDFSEMFDYCKKFNQNLATWNVGNGADFSAMFEDCCSFNQNLDSWDVAKAEKLDWMFFHCRAFDQSLASWQVQGVKEARRHVSMDVADLPGGKGGSPSKKSGKNDNNSLVAAGTNAIARGTYFIRNKFLANTSLTEFAGGTEREVPEGYATEDYDINFVVSAVENVSKLYHAQYLPLGHDCSKLKFIFL